MSGTFNHTLAAGSFRMLAFDVEGRNLTGEVVRLFQGTIVRLGRIACLPGWVVLRAILQTQEAGPQFLVHDENVAQISAPLVNGQPAFQPAAPVFLTAGDTTMVPPFAQRVMEDAVVCDATGMPLAISAGDVVKVFVYNQATLAWFNTADGQTFLVDPRRPVRMALVEPDNGGRFAPRDGTPQEPPMTPQPDEPADHPDLEGVEKDTEDDSGIPASPGGRSQGEMDGGEDGDEGIVPHAETPPPQLEQTPDAPNPQSPVGPQETPEPVEEDFLLPAMRIGFDEEGQDHATQDPATDFDARVLAAVHEADMAALARVQQVSPADFGQTDEDFCDHCWAFTYEHAAYCPFGRGIGQG